MACDVAPSVRTEERSVARANRERSAVGLKNKVERFPLPRRFVLLVHLPFVAAVDSDMRAKVRAEADALLQRSRHHVPRDGHGLRAIPTRRAHHPSRHRPGQRLEEPSDAGWRCSLIACVLHLPHLPLPNAARLINTSPFPTRMGAQKRPVACPEDHPIAGGRRADVEMLLVVGMMGVMHRHAVSVVSSEPRAAVALRLNRDTVTVGPVHQERFPGPWRCAEVHSPLVSTVGTQKRSVGAAKTVSMILHPE
jgi:hypothetical protein